MKEQYVKVVHENGPHKGEVNTLPFPFKPNEMKGKVLSLSVVIKHPERETVVYDYEITMHEDNLYRYYEAMPLRCCFISLKPFDDAAKDKFGDLLGEDEE